MTHVQAIKICAVLVACVALAFPTEALAQRKQRKVIEEEAPKKSGSTIDVEKELKKQLAQSWEKKFQQALALYADERYREADSLWLCGVERADGASAEQKTLAMLWRAKALIQLERYLEAGILHAALENATLAPALRSELLFDKAVLRARQGDYVGATQQLVSLVPNDWTMASGGALIAKAHRYLTLLVNAYLSEQELRTTLPAIQNPALRSLFEFKIVEHLLRRGAFSEAIAELTRFRDQNPTLDPDEQRRAADLKFQAMQLKNGYAKRLRVGVLLPATLNPFDNSSDLGASKLLLGAILAKDEANRVSQNVFLHLSIRSTSGLRPESVVEQAKSLIDKDSAQVILGPMYSEEAIAVSHYCASRGVVMVTPTATDERISKVSPMSFQFNPTHKERGAAIARFAIQDLNAKTAGVFAQDSTYGKEMALGFKAEFEKLGGEVKFFALLPEKFSSFTKALEPLNLAFDKEFGYPLTRFDVIYLPMTSPEAVAIALSQLRFYNIQGELLGTSDWLDERLLNNRELVANFYYASDFHLGENSATSGVANLCKARFGEEPNAFFWLGYDAMNYLCQIALARDAEQNLAEALKNAPPIATHHIPAFFDGGNVNRAMNIIRFSNGTMARVK
ncbi:MAG: ABC transporter substrate-binding protein [Chloroherpetonaceae bacterium]|nr:ABC transporter substrate-binding protein [Chloroherpetonaceae bacterium]MDW8438355.1 ABC transporter substrate-binding protein [Chloroherpetonaceae bacterium]